MTCKITQEQLDEAWAVAVAEKRVSVLLEVPCEITDGSDPTDPTNPDPIVTRRGIANNVGHVNTNLFHDRDKNTNQFPIWRIQEPRIQYLNGQIITIFPERIKGDSDKYAYAVADEKGLGFFVLEVDILL